VWCTGSLGAAGTYSRAGPEGSVAVCPPSGGAWGRSDVFRGRVHAPWQSPLEYQGGGPPLSGGGSAVPGAPGETAGEVGASPLRHILRSGLSAWLPVCPLSPVRGRPRLGGSFGWGWGSGAGLGAGSRPLGRFRGGARRPSPGSGRGRPDVFRGRVRPPGGHHVWCPPSGEPRGRREVFPGGARGLGGKSACRAGGCVGPLGLIPRRGSRPPNGARSRGFRLRTRRSCPD